MVAYVQVYCGDRLLADKVRVADTIWRRFRGLLGRSGLMLNEGLLIKPCKGVHMFGMRHSIDVLFLTDDAVIAKLDAYLPPMAMSVCMRANQVLELSSGSIARFNLAVGMRLTLLSTKVAQTPSTANLMSL